MTDNLSQHPTLCVRSQRWQLFFVTHRTVQEIVGLRLWVRSALPTPNFGFLFNALARFLRGIKGALSCASFPGAHLVLDLWRHADFALQIWFSMSA